MPGVACKVAAPDLSCLHHQPGQIAAGTGVKRMVLTRLSPLTEEAGALAEVRQHYRGEVLLGSDLLVIQRGQSRHS